MNLNIVLRDPEESHCDSNLCDEIKILYNIFWDDNLSHANPLQWLSLKCDMNVHFWTECCFGNFIDSSICYYLSRAKVFQRKLIKKLCNNFNLRKVIYLAFAVRIQIMWKVFFFFLLCHTASRILVPRPVIDPGPSAMKVWGPNHWTVREFPENLDLTT